MLQVYDTANVGVEGAYDAHEVLVDWTNPSFGKASQTLDGMLDDRRISRAIAVRGWEADFSSGVVHFEITSLFQKWALDPATNHGVLIQGAKMGSGIGRRFVTRSSRSESRWKPALFLYYR
jgi:hypothetical protein